MGDYAWVDGVGEATVTLVAARADETAAQVLERLGPVEEAGTRTFEAAMDLQGSLHDDGTEEERAVFQAERLSGADAEWWVLVEPNGYRLSFERPLQTIADGGDAASFFRNVNAAMTLLRVQEGATTANFDPLLDDEDAARHGEGFPFDDDTSAASFALLERWTGVTLTEQWYAGDKPTFVVSTPIDG